MATSSIILLATILTIQSCLIIDDENVNAVCNSDCTTIQGKFTTEDGKPMKNVSLEFDWKLGPAPGIGIGGKIRKIMTGKTDENGNYKFVFFAKDEELKDGAYLITFKTPDNSYIIHENYSYFPFYGVNKRDTTIIGNYHVPRKGANITLKIKNPEAISGEDRLFSSVSYKFDLNQWVYYGAGELNSTLGSQATFETAANQFTYIRTSKKINGQYINLLDSIFIPIHETKLYEIEF